MNENGFFVSQVTVVQMWVVFSRPPGPKSLVTVSAWVINPPAQREVEKSSNKHFSQVHFSIQHCEQFSGL